MRLALSNRVLVAVAAGGAAVVGAGWWLAASVATLAVGVAATERDEWASHATSLALTAARQAREAIPRALDAAGQGLAQIQARQNALLRADRQEAEQLERALLAMTRRAPGGIRLLAASDANGILTWTSQPGVLPGWLGDQGFFTTHRQGRAETTISRRSALVPGEQPSLMISRPLLGLTGDFAGIALVALEPGRIIQALPATLAANEPTLALYDLDGGLLARGRGANAMPAQLDRRLLPEAGGERAQMLRDRRDDHAFATAAAQVPGHDLVVVATLHDSAGASGTRHLGLFGYGLATALTALWLGALGWLGWRRDPAGPTHGSVAAEPPDQAAPAQPVSKAVLTQTTPGPIQSPPISPRIPRRGRAATLAPGLIEAMPTASYAALVGHDGRVQVTTLSPGLERLTGWPPAVFQDPDRWQRNIDWTSYPPGQPLPERLLQEPEAEVEYRLKRADGRWMWLRETCRVMTRDSEGIEVLGSLQDVTREHDLVDQATRAATQGIVAAGLAHDLKGPLQTISFAAQNGLDALASGTAGTEEVRQRLLRVVMQSERAAAIARQLGDFAQLDSLKLEPVALATAVRAVMGEVALPLQEAGIEVHLRLADNLPPVRGLSLMVEQVLVNLCLNARDAMLTQPTGQRLLRLNALYRIDADQVELTLTDSGGGLEPALLERVFEMHFTTKERSKGNGLGLTLCRFIMTRFGGSIALRNVAGGAEARLLFCNAQRLASSTPSQQALFHPSGPGGGAVEATAAG